MLVAWPLKRPGECASVGTPARSGTEGGATGTHVATHDVPTVQHTGAEAAADRVRCGGAHGVHTRGEAAMGGERSGDGHGRHVQGETERASGGDGGGRTGHTMSFIMRNWLIAKAHNSIMSFACLITRLIMNFTMRSVL